MVEDKDEEKSDVKKEEDEKEEEKPDAAAVEEKKPKKEEAGEEEVEEKMEVDASKPAASSSKESKDEPMDVSEEGKENKEEKPSIFENVQFNRDARNRVKLYVLCEQRVWDDRGTGHVACLPTPDQPGNFCIVVRLEANGVNGGTIAERNVLESKIQLDTIYQKQQETLIVWSESDTCDLALSFQEKSGCEDIWEMICQVQGRDPDQQEAYDDDDGDLSEGGASGSTPNNAGSGIQLPAVEMGRLVEIELALANHLGSQQLRDKMANAIEANNYVHKLCDLFRMCEDIDNVEGLHVFYNIAKHLFMLNRNNLIEILLSQEYLKDIIGMLEYEPNRDEPRRHREFLYEKSHFKEVLPMENEQLRAKIHQTYRVQYVQDVCLPAPSLFEENLLSVLNSYIFFSRVDIVAMLQEDRKLMRDLFEQLKDPETSVERRKDLACFLKEFCSFSQSLQPGGPQGKESFYKTLMSNDVLGTIEPCIRSVDPVTRTTTVDMLAMLVDFNPQQIREYLLRQAKDKSDDEMLLNLLIRHMHNDDDVELSSAQQVAHVLRILLDPENMQLSMQKAEKSEFLTFFYSRAIGTLCKPFLANVSNGNRPRDDSYKTANEEALVLRLLCFCIEHHSYQMRQHCISNNLLSKALVLLSSRHHFLKLAALKMLRCVVQLKDDFYNRFIVREKILDKVVECFVENGPKYNLLNSALLELFEFIRQEDVKILIKYTVENHIVAFEDVDYVKTFANLKQKYEQQKHREEEKERVAAAAKPEQHEKWRKERNVDQEEAWFSGEGEEEEEDEEGKDEKSPSKRNGEVTRKTGAEPSFPSVLRKRAAAVEEEEEAAVFGASSGPSILAQLIQSEKKEKTPPPRIVIRVGDRSRSPSPSTPSLSQLTVSSPRSPSPKARDDEVSSSEKTPDNSKPATPSSEAIILKKGLSGLVDYDGSSSSSDEEESTAAGGADRDSVSSSSASSPAPSTSGSTHSGVDDDVTSTSGDHDEEDDASSVCSRRSNGRRKLEELDEVDEPSKLARGPTPVKRVRCADDETDEPPVKEMDEGLVVPP